MFTYRLMQRPGWGSVIVEAQLHALGLPFTLEEVPDLFASEEGRKALEPLNPLAQVPTLVLPEGGIMTESAAITLYLADRTGRDDFVPGAQEAVRADFLRWLIFLVANVYPTFTYADDPSRFVKEETHARAFGQAVDDYRLRLWAILEAAAGAPWFLGERRSALDIYVAAMTHWRPGRRWFDANAPKLLEIAIRAGEDPALRPVWERNFPKDYATIGSQEGA